MFNLKLLIPIFVILANAFILYYVIDMEKKKCECSESWIRNYIKVVSVLIIGINVLVIVYPNFINVLSKNIKKNKILHLLLILLNLVILTYVVLIVVYYIKLNQLQDCKCSENWKRYALLYPLVFMVPIIVFILYNLVLGKNIEINLRAKELK